MTEDEQIELAKKISIESSFNEAVTCSYKKPQLWYKLDDPTLLIIRKHQFLIQQFSCQTMERILYVGIGCSINPCTNTVYSLLQFNFKPPDLSTDLLLFIKSLKAFENSFDYVIFEDSNIINFIYDDKVNTLAILSLFSLIESIDKAQQIKFFNELTRLIAQYHADFKIKILDRNNISNTTSWRGQASEFSDQFMVSTPLLPQQAMEQKPADSKIETSNTSITPLIISLDEVAFAFEETELLDKSNQKMKFYGATNNSSTHFRPNKSGTTEIANPIYDFKKAKHDRF